VSPKSYTHSITTASCHIAWKKFCEDTPTSPEVIRAHTLSFRPNFKFSGLNLFKGTPIPDVVCAIKSWSICNACKNLRGQHGQRPKCCVPQNVRLRWSIWASITLLFVDQSSPNFFRQTWKGLWLIKYFSYLQYVDAFRRHSRSKSKVVRKRSEWWTFFSRFQILGGRPSKSYTHFITPVSRHVPWKKFCGDAPTSLEVIGAHMLNFKPNFKFSRLNFLGGAPSQLWFALASLGQSVSHIKIWRGSTPKVRNIVSRKMSAWVGQYEPL